MIFAIVWDLQHLLIPPPQCACDEEAIPVNRYLDFVIGRQSAEDKLLRRLDGVFEDLLDIVPSTVSHQWAVWSAYRHPDELAVGDDPQRQRLTM